jgi:hypothetical protein
MVQLVFGRVENIESSGGSSSKLSFAVPMNSQGPSVEGDSTVVQDSGEEKDEVTPPATQPAKRIATVRSSMDILGPIDSNSLPSSSSGEETLNNELVKDAYLVFRALSKLSMKPIPNPER